MRQIYQRTTKLKTIHLALHLRDDIDYMCQEKKEEEDLSSLRIVRMYQHKDSNTMLKRAKKGLS